MFGFSLDPGAGGLLHCLLDHLLHARNILEPEEHGFHSRLQEWTLPLAPAEPELQGGGDRARISASMQQQGPGWSGFGEWKLYCHLYLPYPRAAQRKGLESVPEQ